MSRCSSSTAGSLPRGWRSGRRFVVGAPLALALLVAPAELEAAASGEYKQILVEAKGDAVEVRLPLTDVTGAARVKRRTPDGFGIPVAPSKTQLDAACYVEWQIGYDTTDADDVSVVPRVKFQRAGRTKYGSELTKILAEALRIGLLPRAQLAAARGALPRLNAVNLEAAEKVALHPEPPVTRDAGLPEGFERFVQKVPQMVKSTPHGAIEIQFKPKQRAVGYQAMIYVCLPLPQWRTASGAPRAPGPARPKETVIYTFTGENLAFLLDIVRAFAIASPAHNEDLTKIFDALLAE